MEIAMLAIAILTLALVGYCAMILHQAAAGAQPGTLQPTQVGAPQSGG